MAGRGRAAGQPRADLRAPRFEALFAALEPVDFRATLVALLFAALADVRLLADLRPAVDRFAATVPARFFDAVRPRAVLFETARAPVRAWAVVRVARFAALRFAPVVLLREADRAPVFFAADARRAPVPADLVFRALPPFFAAVLRARPEPDFFPPPVNSLTVAHALRSASSFEAPRFS